jgi:hypothetical protein
MTTVGYGDFSPKNQTEMIFSILSLLTSCGVFGYSLNQIGNIIQEIKSQGILLKESIMTINNYMDRKQIDPSLQQ